MWTEQQIKYLISHSGTMTSQMIADRLKKAKSTVRDKQIQLGITGGFRVITDYYTLADISEIIGIQTTYWISTWRRNGFKTKRIGNYSVCTEKEMKAFMRDHPWLWDWQKCDQAYFRGDKWFQNIKEKGNGKRRHKRWTKLEAQRAVTMYHSGKSYKEIAEWMNRSVSSVKHKVEQEVALMIGKTA